MARDRVAVVAVVGLGVAGIAACQLFLRGPGDPKDSTDDVPTNQAFESEFEVDIDGDGEADGIRLNGEYIDFGTTTVPPGGYGSDSDSYSPPLPDRDCSDFSGPVPVGDMDPYGLDRDDDGVGCE